MMCFPHGLDLQPSSGLLVSLSLGGAYCKLDAKLAMHVSMSRSIRTRFGRSRGPLGWKFCAVGRLSCGLTLGATKKKWKRRLGGESLVWQDRDVPDHSTLLVVEAVEFIDAGNRDDA